MKKILLIEDNSELRENTAEILQLANYDVIIAENGKTGVELANQEMPDLIICDIMMPELDGYGVLHILSKKPETERIPFIFLTAKTEKSDIRKGMTLGADDYLTKPFDDTDLLNAIEVRLRKSGLFKKNYESTAAGLDLFLKEVKDLLKVSNLFKDKKVKNFKKKTEIYTEGETPNAVFFIKSGNIKTCKAHPDGKELIINLYRENDFFGYEPILENTAYTDLAVAMDDTEIIVFPRVDFLTLINSQPEISKSFVSLLCKKVAEKEAQLLHLAYNSVRQRTAEALLKVFHLKNEKGLLTIPREDLAKMVGTAPESVIRVLSNFKDEGLIDIISGKIKLEKSTQLEQVVRWNVARK